MDREEREKNPPFFIYPSLTGRRKKGSKVWHRKKIFKKIYFYGFCVLKRSLLYQMG